MPKINKYIFLLIAAYMEFTVPLSPPLKCSTSATASTFIMGSNT